MGNHPGLPRWVPCSHRGPLGEGQAGETGQRRRPWGQSTGEGMLLPALTTDGGAPGPGTGHLERLGGPGGSLSARASRRTAALLPLWVLAQ